MNSPVFMSERPAVSDPFEEVLAVLQPRAVHSKCMSAAGRWGVRYSNFGQPSFGVALEGACLLAVDGQEPITLAAGDFVLLPQTPAFTLSGFESVQPIHFDPKTPVTSQREIRHGDREGPADVRLLGGFFAFDSPDAALMVSLLPAQMHVRGAEQLSGLIRLIDDEARAPRSGQELILTRLVEVLLIEVLRSTAGEHMPPGLLRGLSDARIAQAMRGIHSDPARAWTVPGLAAEAALSRSAFFERFTKTVGVPPMEYLLVWRMAVAKNLLRRRELGLSEVAERVGYGSASTFSIAFSRHVGQPPGQYARAR